MILPWIENDDLPNMKFLIEEGVFSKLMSTIPMFSATAWSSFATGLNPGRHGITGFIIKDIQTGKVRVVSSLDRKGKDLWEIVGEKGKRSIIINVPLTYPPKKINGLMITGLLTPPQSKRYTYPIDLKDEIERNIGKFITYPVCPYEEGNEDAFIRSIHEMTHNQIQIAIYLMKKYLWDLFIIVFNGTDLIQHALWKYVDEKHPAHDRKKAQTYVKEIKKYYQTIDNDIGVLREIAGDDLNLIILSDHGFDSLYKFIHVNNILMKSGYITFNNNFAVYIKRILYLLGLTPNNLYNILLKIRMGKIRSLLGRRKGHSLMAKFFLSSNDINWKKTLAYSFGSMGQIYLNKNINKNSVIYKELKDKIITLLKNLKDPDTEKLVIESIYLKDDIYTGDNITNMPDIVFMPQRGYISFEESEFASNSFFSEPHGISGTHRPEGILMLHGPNFKEGYELQTIPNIIDLTPTILKLMSHESEKLDGRPIIEAFESKNNKKICKNEYVLS